MKHRLILFCLVIVLAAVMIPALGSEEFCIQFDGIDPNGSSACGPAYSRALEYHHLVARELTGGVPGALQHQQVIVTKRADAADPLLWQRLDSGAVLAQVRINSPSGGGAGRDSFVIILNNARILGLEPIIPHTQDPGNTSFGDQTRIRMDYQSLSIQYGSESPYVITP